MAFRKHIPTEAIRKQVEAMTGYGVPQTAIAHMLGFSQDTLQRHYRAELDTGQTKANMKVAQNLFRMATGDGREACTAAIFWLKTRAGWREVWPEGKKEQADREATTAAEGTFWEKLLN